MNGSIIIFGSSQDSREKKCFEIAQSLELANSENNPDLKILKTIDDKKSIGIDDIREAVKFLSNKPFSHKYKLLVISESHYMTREAQNALLKTLEEPPAYATLILLAKTEESVLPAVLSRCRKISLNKSMKSDSTSETENVFFTELLNQSTGDRLEWAAETSKKDKKEIIDNLEILMLEGRSYLKEQTGGGAVTLLNNLNKVKSDLENTNLSAKIALEFIATNTRNPSHTNLKHSN